MNNIIDALGATCLCILIGCVAVLVVGMITALLSKKGR